jgi:hypothetical protein
VHLEVSGNRLQLLTHLGLWSLAKAPCRGGGVVFSLAYLRVTHTPSHGCVAGGCRAWVYVAVHRVHRHGHPAEALKRFFAKQLHVHLVAQEGFHLCIIANANHAVRQVTSIKERFIVEVNRSSSAAFPTAIFRSGGKPHVFTSSEMKVPEAVLGAASETKVRGDRRQCKKDKHNPHKNFCHDNVAPPLHSSR